MIETSNKTTTACRGGWRPTLLMTLAASILGGVVGLSILRSYHPVFPKPELPEMAQFPSEAERALHSNAELNYHRENGASNYALIGGCLGFFIGVLTTCGMKRVYSSITGSIAGAAAGGSVGWLIGERVGTDINASVQQSLFLSALYHMAVWAAIALLVFVTIALWHDLRQIKNAIVGGLIGGLLASLIYNVVVSIVNPSANLSIITPEQTTESIVSIGLGSLALGLCLWLGFRLDSPPSKAPEVEPNKPAI